MEAAGGSETSVYILQIVRHITGNRYLRGGGILAITYQLFTHFWTGAYITERGPHYNYQTLLPDLKAGIQ